MSCFRLTGKKLSGIFEPDFKPAQIEEQELLGKKNEICLVGKNTKSGRSRFLQGTLGYYM